MRRPATLHIAHNSGHTTLSLLMACTPSERARGLMHRRTLKPFDGMVFVFEEAAPRTFWMRNTPLPLDLLFFDGAHRLVCIVDHAEPNSDVPRSCNHPVSTVIELPGGTAARLLWAEGARLEESHGALAALCRR